MMGPGAGQGAGLERVPLGLVLELQCDEGKGKGWGKGWPPALVLKVEDGLSEQGEAVLQVRVELGLPPCAEVSHCKKRGEWDDGGREVRMYRWTRPDEEDSLLF